jgi:acetoin utilization deacetylase AcuC-like enzyme
VRFGLLTDETFVRHRTTEHVERPERLEAILSALEAAEFEVDFERFPGRLATDHELRLCHHQAVLDRVKSLTESGGGNLDPDTYLNEWSDEAARKSVGGGIDLCRAVLEGRLDRGFSICRPPGHHATPERSMGFCLYSTVAVVAKACADLAHRILVLDWDVHHGNGTQDCLYDHAGTCFISLHQSPFYPGSGYPDERGEGPGAGSIYNIPLPAGCGDPEYMSAYLTLVRPIIQKYDPHLLIVSAGYDAHQKDLLGGMKVTRDGFRQLATWVAEDADSTSAKGRLVGFLEGGYHLGGLSESVIATLAAWTGPTAPLSSISARPNDRVKRLLNELSTRFEL